MTCPHDITERDVSATADGLCPLCLAADNERLRALVAEAAEILDGDGEYPSTAKRFRNALEQKQSDT